MPKKKKYNPTLQGKFNGSLTNNFCNRIEQLKKRHTRSWNGLSKDMNGIISGSFLASLVRHHSGTPKPISIRTQKCNELNEAITELRKLTPDEYKSKSGKSKGLLLRDASLEDLGDRALDLGYLVTFARILPKKVKK
ncbi:hypothetical protein ACFL35_03930 [Candidatus Riflebacteria bacterium]